MKPLVMTPERIKQKEVIIKTFGHKWAYGSKTEFEWWYKKAKDKLDIKTNINQVYKTAYDLGYKKGYAKGKIDGKIEGIERAQKLIKESEV